MLQPLWILVIFMPEARVLGQSPVLVQVAESTCGSAPHHVCIPSHHAPAPMTLESGPDKPQDMHCSIQLEEIFRLAKPQLVNPALLPTRALPQKLIVNFPLVKPPVLYFGATRKKGRIFCLSTCHGFVLCDHKNLQILAEHPHGRSVK